MNLYNPQTALTGKPRAPGLCAEKLNTLKYCFLWTHTVSSDNLSQVSVVSLLKGIFFAIVMLYFLRTLPSPLSQSSVCFCKTDFINSNISVIKKKKWHRGQVVFSCHLINGETEVFRRLRRLQMVSQQVKGGAESPACGLSVWSVPRQ